MSQQINLYNPIFLKQEKHFSARTMLQATGVVLLGAAGVCAYAWYQVASIEGLAEDSRNSLKVQRDQLVKLGAQVASKGHSRAIELEIERTRVQVNDRRALLASLQGGAQGGTEGFSRYLAAFARQTSRGVWLTGLSMSGNGQDLNVSGRALHADMLPGYLDALGKEDVMRGRQVIELKLSAHVQDAGKAPVQQGPARYVEFTLSAPMRKGAEAFAMPAGKAASKGAS
ncbi:MAG: PilN domain-containing protein [Betaproteobacteria bacterium]|nr:PilN domain-containing protein [Betaproteobacteria bacterium]